MLQAAIALYYGLGFCESDEAPPLSGNVWPQRKLLKMELLESEEESESEAEARLASCISQMPVRG